MPAEPFFKQLIRRDPREPRYFCCWLLPALALVSAAFC
jgi:hypothetical protein